MTGVRLQRVGSVGLVYAVIADGESIGYTRRSLRGTWEYAGPDVDMVFRPAGGRREDAVACLLAEAGEDLPPCEQPNAHRAGTCLCVMPEVTP